LAENTSLSRHITAVHANNMTRMRHSCTLREWIVVVTLAVTSQWVKGWKQLVRV